MIRGLILDIDGVIVGGKPGFNFPVPHPEVTKALKTLHQIGISISFCTAKPGFVIKNLVNLIGLDTIHISNGGAEITNHIKNTVIKKHTLDQQTAINFIKTIKTHNLYVEAYTTSGYAIEHNAYCSLTDINVSILNTAPQKVKSLEKFIEQHEIIKIMPAAFTPHDKQIIEKMMENFSDLQLQWGANPMYAPTLYGVVTKIGITKKSGAYDISKHTQIPLEEMLGIGDGTSDLEFMELCGYAATVANADNKVKEYILGQKEKGFLGKSVDENGIIDILKYYSLM